MHPLAAQAGSQTAAASPESHAPTIHTNGNTNTQPSTTAFMSAPLDRFCAGQTPASGSAPWTDQDSDGFSLQQSNPRASARMGRRF
jgi:hypothetical protein